MELSDSADDLIEGVFNDWEKFLSLKYSLNTSAPSKEITQKERIYRIAKKFHPKKKRFMELFFE
jgi:hypothetical protein